MFTDMVEASLVMMNERLNKIIYINTGHECVDGGLSSLPATETSVRGDVTSETAGVAASISRRLVI